MMLCQWLTATKCWRDNCSAFAWAASPSKTR